MGLQYVLVLLRRMLFSLTSLVLHYFAYLSHVAGPWILKSSRTMTVLLFWWHHHSGGQDSMEIPFSIWSQKWTLAPLLLENKPLHCRKIVRFFMMVTFPPSLSASGETYCNQAYGVSRDKFPEKYHPFKTGNPLVYHSHTNLHSCSSYSSK